MTHTPGPYQSFNLMIMADGKTNTYDGTVIGTIAIARSLEQSDSEGRKWTCKGDACDNAKLFAAAPDLLDALNNLMVAVAMGPLDLAAKYGPDAHPDEPIIDASRQARAAIAKATNPEVTL